MAGTVAIISLSVAAVVGGRAVLADRLSAEVELVAAPVATVPIETIALQTHYTVTRRYAGQFEAPQTTALAFEEGGTIGEILVQEGDVVAAGDVIARLDTRLLDAERARLIASRDAVAAQVELARRTNERQTELQERGFASNQAVDDTSLTLVRLNAQMAEIDAALAALDVRLSKSVLRAPFAGPIGDRLFDVGAIAGPGEPVVSLLEDAPVLFRAGIDPRRIEALSVATDLTIDVGSTTLAARFDRIAPELDASTRAQTAFFSVDGATPPSGAAGEIRLNVEMEAPSPGTWLPLSALRQGPRGTWQVLVVDDRDTGPTVAVAAVELIYAADTQVFVTGTLFEGQAFITGGTHRVVPGERVTPLTEPREVASWEG
ncbi:MAG: efflux RND transporter periplasmic adaptor subunit [Pseudomonadota bacterium]